LRFESADDCLDPADDGDILGVDWRHRRILRLQPDASGLAVEPLNGRFTFDHGDDDLAVGRIGPRIDDDQIAVKDRRIDHRVALHTEHECPRAADESGRQDEHLFEVLSGRDRYAGRNPADDGNHRDFRPIGVRGGRHGRAQRPAVIAWHQRARFGWIAPKQTAPLECL
jgi:hypothetical protein